jgi:hypothetical protein
MKYVAEIEVPDGADWQTLEDAKLCAKWRRVYSLHDRMSRTDLTDKCGSCKYFVRRDYASSKCSGDCVANPYYPKTFKYRTTPKCKCYERREDE